jgi:RNA polymerase sigma-70 factor (ECF subfamily)
LRRYLGNGTLAEDAFQMTFLQVHLKCDQFEEGRRLRPWLYTIATHQAIDAQRRSRRHRMVSLDASGGPRSEGQGTLGEVLVSAESSPNSKVEARERGLLVRSRVDALPDSLKSAVVLVYYQGLKYREAADVLGIPVGTVKSRLHTAIGKLNEAWSSPTEDEPR